MPLTLGVGGMDSASSSTTPVHAVKFQAIGGLCADDVQRH